MDMSTEVLLVERFPSFAARRNATGDGLSETESCEISLSELIDHIQRRCSNFNFQVTTSVATRNGDLVVEVRDLTNTLVYEFIVTYSEEDEKQVSAALNQFS